jgi:hypothetical protein
MHQVTDARAEMAERLKLISLPNRLQLLGDDKATRQQDSQDRKRDGQGKSRGDLCLGLSVGHGTETSLQHSRQRFLSKR